MSAEAITREHPEIWREAFQKALDEHLPELEAEAASVQHYLMRLALPRTDKDTGKEVTPTVEERKIGQSAAHSLLAHTRRLRPQRVDVAGSVTHNHTLSDAQLREVDREIADAGLRNGKRIRITESSN